MSDSQPQDGDQSILSRILSAEIKGLLVLRDRLPQPDGACTICGDDSKELKVSYILSEEDERKFKSFVGAGYIPDLLAKLDDPENLLLTCTTCAELFDRPTPTIVVLPDDPEYFILWEHRDFERRTFEATSGKMVSSRTVPEHDDYGAGWKLYVLSDDPKTLPETLRAAVEGGKRKLYTEAAPTALILHAGRSIGVPMTYPAGYGIPHRMSRKLLELFALWERPPPGKDSPPPSAAVQSVATTKYTTPPRGRKSKRKKSLSLSSGDDSLGLSGSGMIKTPRSKRQKMKALTKGDNKQRKKAELKGLKYTSPASPERWQFSTRRTVRSLPNHWKPPLRGYDGTKRMARMRMDERLTDEDFDDYGEEDGDDAEDPESEEEEEEGNDALSGNSADDDNWDFGPGMSSSAIIESAAKRSFGR